jgi:hypothetical protein
MDATEKLVDDILEDRISIKDLDILQMEAVIEFMRENIEEMAEAAEDEDEEQYAEGLLTLVELIEDAVDLRFEAESGSEWEKAVEASIARGNSYFELENYVLQ